MQTSEALGHIAHRLEIAGGQDRLHMGLAAGLAEIAHLVIKRPPVAGQHMLARDDDVDLLRAVAHRSFDFLELQVMRHKPRRKAGGNGRNRNAAALQRLDGSLHEAMINADRARMDVAVGQSQLLQNIFAHRLLRLGAKPAHPRAVSSPLNVVRSMQVTAFRSQAACASFLTVRRPGRLATRRSDAERLMRTSSIQSRSKATPALRAGS